MTYLQFHLLFLLPPLAILSTRLPRAFAALGPRARLGLIVIPLIALVYTTPWDNYLVANEIWGYGEGRVLGTIGWVPIEEYTFFILPINRPQSFFQGRKYMINHTRSKFDVH